MKRKEIFLCISNSSWSEMFKQIGSEDVGRIVRRNISHCTQEKTLSQPCMSLNRQYQQSNLIKFLECELWWWFSLLMWINITIWMSEFIFLKLVSLLINRILCNFPSLMNSTLDQTLVFQEFIEETIFSSAPRPEVLLLGDSWAPVHIQSSLLINRYSKQSTSQFTLKKTWSADEWRELRDKVWESQFWIKLRRLEIRCS